MAGRVRDPGRPPQRRAGGLRPAGGHPRGAFRQPAGGTARGRGAAGGPRSVRPDGGGGGFRRDRSDRRRARPRHQRRYRGRASGGRAGQAGVPARSLRQLLALAERAARQPVVSECCASSARNASATGAGRWTRSRRPCARSPRPGQASGPPDLRRSAGRSHPPAGTIRYSRNPVPFRVPTSRSQGGGWPADSTNHSASAGAPAAKA